MEVLSEEDGDRVDEGDSVEIDEEAVVVNIGSDEGSSVATIVLDSGIDEPFSVVVVISRVVVSVVDVTSTIDISALVGPGLDEASVNVVKRSVVVRVDAEIFPTVDVPVFVTVDSELEVSAVVAKLTVEIAAVLDVSSVVVTLTRTDSDVEVVPTVSVVTVCSVDVRAVLGQVSVVVLSVVEDSAIGDTMLSVAEDHFDEDAVAVGNSLAADLDIVISSDVVVELPTETVLMVWLILEVTSGSIFEVSEDAGCEVVETSSVEVVVTEKLEVSNGTADESVESSPVLLAEACEDTSVAGGDSSDATTSVDVAEIVDAASSLVVAASADVVEVS